MKNFKTLFGMAVLGLMAAACTNDVDEVLAPEAPLQGYHFIATIAPKTSGATTRTLLEEVKDGDDVSLSSTWKVGDKIYIVYQASSSRAEVEAEVKEVSEDGSATIEASFEKLPTSTDEQNAYLQYPITSKFDEQDGRLSSDRDLRYGWATLKVDGEKVTFEGTPSLDAEGSIFKFTMVDFENASINVDKLVISSKDYWDEDDGLTITVTPTAAASELYVTIPIPDTGSVHTFWFEATSGSSPYIAQATGSLEIGYYYQSTLKMATVGNVIGADGAFYVDSDAASDASTTAEAMIAYLGSEAENAEHGLAIALEDVKNGEITTFEWATNTVVSNWESGHVVSDGKWCLPSVDYWMYIFQGCGGDKKAKLEDGMRFSYGNFCDKLKAAGGEEANVQSDNYWSATGSSEDNAFVYDFNEAMFFGTEKAESHYVRAVLAF